MMPLTASFKGHMMLFKASYAFETPKDHPNMHLRRLRKENPEEILQIAHESCQEPFDSTHSSPFRFSIAPVSHLDKTEHRGLFHCET